jgi:hypothetical protein
MTSIDRVLFQGLPLIARSLSTVENNPQSRLSISRSQRDDLISTIDASFGTTLRNPGNNYTVMGMALLREFLVERKCSDDP